MKNERKKTMELQYSDKISKSQSNDCGKDTDINKLTIDNFEMTSRNHLINTQFKFLVDEAVSNVFNDEIYMKSWKSGFLADLYMVLYSDYFPPKSPVPRSLMDLNRELLLAQQKLLDAITKPDTLNNLCSYIKQNLERFQNEMTENGSIAEFIEELTVDAEYQQSSSDTSD